MRAWAVVAVVFSAVVVLWDVYLTLALLIGRLVGLLVPDDPDRLPSQIMVGHSAGPFPWGLVIVQYGLGLLAAAFLLYVFWHRRRT